MNTNEREVFNRNWTTTIGPEDAGLESKTWAGLSVCCREGTNDRSQAIYCLEGVKSRIHPLGNGLIPTLGWSIVQVVAAYRTQSYRTRRDGSIFAPVPGNELPGYFHNVPTGQRHLTPVHEFVAASDALADDEDSGFLRS